MGINGLTAGTQYRLNRTLEELKLLLLKDSSRSCACLNRTLEELKRFVSTERGCFGRSLNRTLEELKHKFGAFWKPEKEVLIEP